MSNRRLLAVSTTLLLLFLVGCSKEEAPPPVATQPTAAPTAPPVDPATAATVAGKVTFKDGKPKRARIAMDADAFCKAAHTQAVLSEQVMLNDNGTLRNVLVYVKEGLGGHAFPPAKTPVVLDQKGCVYTPHVVGVQVSQEMHVMNSDQTTHNIHPTPEVNREWNESQPPGADHLVKTFAREELAIPVKCNIHPWMRSYISVFKHPFFAVTKEDGSFEIKGLPPGDYTIAAWHEKYGETTQKVTVGPKESKTVEFVIQPTGAGD